MAFWQKWTDLMINKSRGQMFIISFSILNQHCFQIKAMRDWVFPVMSLSSVWYTKAQVSWNIDLRFYLQKKKEKLFWETSFMCLCRYISLSIYKCYIKRQKLHRPYKVFWEVNYRKTLNINSAELSQFFFSARNVKTPNQAWANYGPGARCGPFSFLFRSAKLYRII